MGPGRGAAGNTLQALNAIFRSSKLAKYIPLLDVSLDSYYLSRTATPFNFFNRRWEQLYSPEFRAETNKEWSISPIRRYFENARSYSTLSKMLYIDTKSWLPDDLLVKADKMTMANSVELRVPFLDHKVLEFAAALPPNFKLRRFTTKYLAKKALGAHVPREILDRRKAGFPVPYESWIKTELKGWIQDLLLDGRSIDRGYFSRTSVEQLLRSGYPGGAHSKEIFSLAVLELWHRVFLDGARAPQSDAEAPSMTQLALQS